MVSEIDAKTKAETKPDAGKPAEAQELNAAELLTTPGSTLKTGSAEIARERNYANAVLGAVDVVANPLAGKATELIKDGNGKIKEVPLEKFLPGDHTIKLKDGREFIAHVPDNDGKTPLPVIFVFSGSAHNQYDIKDFVPESGINTYADDKNHKFIAVYPLPLKHLLGTGSNKPAYGWNVLDPKGGTLIDKKDSKFAGYDDLDFVKRIVDILPQVANVDANHKDWAAIGFSQGGVFLNYVAANVPNLFPTIGLVGSAIQNDYKYDIKQGNAENVAIVNLRADFKTLPFKDSENARYRTEVFLHAVLPKRKFEKLNDLAAINNIKSDPGKQMRMYEDRLGAHTKDVTKFATPAASNAKDREILFKSKDPTNPRQLAVFDLPLADHSYPEKDPSGARTNAAPKYTEFETNKHIIDLWMNYNKRIKP